MPIIPTHAKDLRDKEGYGVWYSWGCGVRVLRANDGEVAGAVPSGWSAGVLGAGGAGKEVWMVKKLAGLQTGYLQGLAIPLIKIG